MPFDIDVIYLIYILVALAAILAIEAAYLIISRRVTYKQRANARLQGFDGSEDGEQILVELRRQRGLSKDGRFVLPVLSLNRLVLQSGLRIGMARLIALCLIIAAATFAIVAFYLKFGMVLGTLAAIMTGAVFPFLVLYITRAARRYKFSSQLPDAIDIIVRSLRAGHPVPVALGMVGREMPDPVGSEFGMALDELTYGLDLEETMKNMFHRVEQEDLGLLVTAVSLQHSTGGNLSEVLSNLSRIIRARFKMRRKVRALSAEGRVSAYGLSALPAIVFVTLSVIAPEYYGDIWDEPITVPLLIGIVCWAMVGMAVMYKMVNFKF
ncbi:MAG: type II secretion system F family protein [Hyphomicrobiales bacterium]|nr:type II secretion system F family protein [Hyphomicrobiales bacterium]